MQVGEGGTTTTLHGDRPRQGGDAGDAGAVTSEWPPGTNGFTIQLSSMAKDGATAEAVDAAKQAESTTARPDAAVLDSDLYSSLPPGNYIIYSGVFDKPRTAEAALDDLGTSFPNAQVVEVSGKGDSGDSSGPQSDLARPRVDRRGHEPSELLQPNGGVTESEK